MWVKNNAAQLAELVSTVAGMAMAVLNGQVGAVANAVNNVLKRLLPVVLGFVGALVGVGGVVNKIRKIFKSISKPARQAITKLFRKFQKFVKKMLAKFSKKKKGKGKKLSKAEVKKKVIEQLRRPTKAKDPAGALAEANSQVSSLKSEYQPKLTSGTLKIDVVDSAPKQVEEDGDIDLTVSLSPKTPVEKKFGGKTPNAEKIDAYKTLLKKSGATVSVTIKKPDAPTERETRDYRVATRAAVAGAFSSVDALHSKIIVEGASEVGSKFNRLIGDIFEAWVIKNHAAAGVVLNRPGPVFKDPSLQKSKRLADLGMGTTIVEVKAIQEPRGPSGEEKAQAEDYGRIVNKIPGLLKQKGGPPREILYTAVRYEFSSLEVAEEWKNVLENAIPSGLTISAGDTGARDELGTVKTQATSAPKKKKKR